MASGTTKVTNNNKYHHGDLRRALLEATLRIIDEAGLEAVSLRGVARQLGVSEAAPYHHFSNKQDLLAVLAADAYRGLGERLSLAVGSEDLDRFERLEAAIRTYIVYGLENRGRYRLMFGEHMLDLGEHLAAEGYHLVPSARQILADVVADCVGEKQSAETVEYIVWALSHGITGLINEAEIRFESPTTEIQRLVDTGIAIVTAGIRSYTGETPQAERQ